MPKNRLDKWATLIEEVAQFLIESPASEKAKQLGLHHLGYGYYAKEKGGLPVARSVNGGQELIRIDRTGPYDSDKHQVNKKKSYEAAVDMARTALSKEMTHLLDYTGLDDEIEIGSDDYRALSKMIIAAVEKGNWTNELNAAIDNSTAIDDKIKLINKYLTHFSSNPESASYAAIKGYTNAKTKAQQPEEPQEPVKVASDSIKAQQDQQIHDIADNWAHGLGLTGADVLPLYNVLKNKVMFPYDGENSSKLINIVGQKNYKEIMLDLFKGKLLHVDDNGIVNSGYGQNFQLQGQGDEEQPEPTPVKTPNVSYISQVPFLQTAVHANGTPVLQKIKAGQTLLGSDGHSYVWDSQGNDGWGEWIKQAGSDSVKELPPEETPEPEAIFPPVQPIQGKLHYETNKKNHWGEAIWAPLTNGTTITGTDGNQYVWKSNDPASGDWERLRTTSQEPANGEQKTWETAVDTAWTLADALNTNTSEARIQLAHAIKAVINDPYAWDTNKNLYDLLATFTNIPSKFYKSTMEKLGIKPNVTLSSSTATLEPTEPIEPDANNADDGEEAEEGPKFDPFAALKAMGFKLHSEPGESVLPILQKLANATKAHDVYNSKKALTALGVKPEQWKSLLKYLKQHHQAMQTNPYYEKGKGQVKTGGKKGPKGKQGPPADDVLYAANSSTAQNLYKSIPQIGKYTKHAQTVIMSAINAAVDSGDVAKALDYTQELYQDGIISSNDLYALNNKLQDYFANMSPNHPSKQHPIIDKINQKAGELFNSIPDIDKYTHQAQTHIMDALNNAMGWFEEGNPEKATATIEDLHNDGIIGDDDAANLMSQLEDMIHGSEQPEQPEQPKIKTMYEPGLASLNTVLGPIPGSAEFLDTLSSEDIKHLNDWIDDTLDVGTPSDFENKLNNIKNLFPMSPELMKAFGNKLYAAWEERHGPVDYQDDGEPHTYPSTQEFDKEVDHIMDALSAGGYFHNNLSGEDVQKIESLIKKSISMGDDPWADDDLKGIMAHYLGNNGAYAVLDYIANAQNKLWGTGVSTPAGDEEEPESPSSDAHHQQIHQIATDGLAYIQSLMDLSDGEKDKVFTAIADGMVDSSIDGLKERINNLQAAGILWPEQAQNLINKLVPEYQKYHGEEPQPSKLPTVGSIMGDMGLAQWTTQSPNAIKVINIIEKALNSSKYSDVSNVLNNLTPALFSGTHLPDGFSITTLKNKIHDAWAQKMGADDAAKFGPSNTPEEPAGKSILDIPAPKADFKTADDVFGMLAHEDGIKLSQTFKNKIKPFIDQYINQDDPDTRAEILNVLDNLVNDSTTKNAIKKYLQQINPEEPVNGKIAPQMNAPDETPASSGELGKMMNAPDTEEPGDVSVPGEEHDLVSSIAPQLPFLQNLSPDSRNLLNKVFNTALQQGHNFSSMYDIIEKELDGNLTPHEKQVIAAELFKKHQQQQYQQSTQNPQQDAKDFSKLLGQQWIDKTGNKLSSHAWTGLKDMVNFMFQSAAKGDSDNYEIAVDELYNNNFISPEQATALVNQILPGYAKSQSVPQQPEAPTQPKKSTVAPTQSVADVIKNLQIIPATEKTAATSVNSAWAKGDPKPVMNWAIGKIKKGENKDKWSYVIMALVKNHGLDIGEVPQEYIPDAVKEKLAATTTAQEPIEPEEPETPTTSSPEEPAFKTTSGGKPYELPKNIKQKANQFIQDYGDVEGALAAAQSLLDQNMNTSQREYYSQLVSALKDAYALDQRQQEKQAAKQDKAKEKEKEKAAKKLEKLSPEDTENYIQGYLSSVGVEYNKLSDAHQQALLAATMQALASETEFGVYHAFSQIQKQGILQEPILDGLKVEILDTLAKKGKLDTSPESFKKYFNYSDALNTFLQQNPDFAKGLSQEDKNKIMKAMEHGMSIPDVGKKGEAGYESGYQKAKKFYQDTLVGKIPGFDESTFQKFRNYLMTYHDQFKQIQDYEQQKKAAAEQKKKEAEELQKLLKSLASGDTAGVIKSIANSMGVSNSSDQQKLQVGIAKALQAPTSQDMLDILNTLGGEGTDLGGYVDNHSVSGVSPINGLPASKLHLLKTLVASAYKKSTGKKKAVSEPPSPEPAQARAAHVFQNWFKTSGVTLGYIPKGNQERQTLVNAVTSAINAPSAEKADETLNSLLYPGTSLSDDQIEMLRTAIHQERQNPWALQKKKEPLPTISQHTPKTSFTPKTTQTPTSLSKDVGLISKLKYYKIPTDKQSDVVDLLQLYMSQDIPAWNQKNKAALLKSKLYNLGLPMDTAKNLGNWAVRDTIQGGTTSQLAKTIAASQGSGISSQKVAAVPVGTKDQNAIKQFISNIPQSSDPHDLVKNEWVKGEQLVLSPSLKYVAPQPNNPNHYTAKQQNHTEVKNKLSPQEYAKFKKAASSWQGNGQWGKNAQTRKAVNDIFQKAINGHPPLLAQVDSYVERGMTMPTSDWVEFIKAFEIGKRVALPPSGFSYNRGTATNFGGSSSTQAMHVLMRVRPNKNGKVKAAVLGYSHESEQEIVVGTNKDLRCTNVIKHVINNGYGGTTAAYEIEMVYDDSLNEAVGDNNSAMYAGLSPATLKMIYKYMNTPLAGIPKEGK